VDLSAGRPQLLVSEAEVPDEVFENQVAELTRELVILRKILEG
jgi:hypothetical protein